MKEKEQKQLNQLSKQEKKQSGKKQKQIKAEEKAHKETKPLSSVHTSLGKKEHAHSMEHQKNHDQMDHHENHQMGHSTGGMDHHMHMGNFKQKFWLSLALAIPILLLSPMMGFALPFQFQFAGSDWLVLLLATILFFYGGQPFLSGAVSELKQKKPAMMTLIALGISVSYIYSIYAFVSNHFFHTAHVMDFFWELATLIVIMLLGHWLEMTAVANASNALQKLAELLPDEVTRKTAAGEEKIPLQNVRMGDQLIVRTGDKMPTDGKIIAGTTTVDESAITGESRGVSKKSGDSVIGGSVNGNGTIEIQVTGTGEDGYLAKVMEMVKNAQSEKSNLEALSDKVAKWLFYVALFFGIGAFLIWLLIADLPTALERMVTVFVIACPHALGLAVPLVVARSTSLAAAHGLLLKNRNALENAYGLDRILLDKTGTLTQGTFTVTGVESFSELSEKDILMNVGALEASANHPIADGIMRYLKGQNIASHTAEKVETLSGIGMQGVIAGTLWKIVNQKEIQRLKLSLDNSILAKYQQQGNTISYLLKEDQLMGMIALGDQIKQEAIPFIKELKERNIVPEMLTGDNQKAAEAVAGYLGVENVSAELLPDNKEALVARYTKEGQRVAMVGDGINDAPSLARATVGIAIGAGTDIAIDSADVVLTNSNPQDVLHFLDLAKNTRKKMIENLWWGAGYNIFAIPLAAGVLAPFGIILNPALGAILMSVSTIIVAFNAMTLKINKA